MVDHPFDDALNAPEISREELTRWQQRRITQLASEVIPANRFWADRFAACQVDPACLGDPGEFRKLVPLTKADLVADHTAYPPYGSNLTSPVASYSRLHQTSGTTGQPLRWLDTPASWNWMLGCWEQLFAIMELGPTDRLFFPFSFGPFLGFWAGFEGANRLGNLCLPGGGMSSEARLRFLSDNGATIVCCTPTYALRLAEVARDTGIDLGALGVRRLLVAGEAGGNVPATRARIEREWGATVVDHWGMTEVGPLAMESPRDPGGLCLLESECLVEILDPVTFAPVAEGEEGELVITNFGRTGSPLFRYRTGDRVRATLSREALPVRVEGRWVRVPLVRLAGGILGRVDEMLTIRGNNLYPAALEDVVRTFPGVAEFRIELIRGRQMDQVRIVLECVPQETAPESLAAAISGEIKARWNFVPEITLAASGSLPRFELKARRFTRSDA